MTRRRLGGVPLAPVLAAVGIVGLVTFVVLGEDRPTAAPVPAVELNPPPERGASSPAPAPSGPSSPALPEDPVREAPRSPTMGSGAAVVPPALVPVPAPPPTAGEGEEGDDGGDDVDDDGEGAGTGGGDD